MVQNKLKFINQEYQDKLWMTSNFHLLNYFNILLKQSPKKNYFTAMPLHIFRHIFLFTLPCFSGSWTIHIKMMIKMIVRPLFSSHATTSSSSNSAKLIFFLYIVSVSITFGAFLLSLSYYTSSWCSICLYNNIQFYIQIRYKSFLSELCAT